MDVVARVAGGPALGEMFRIPVAGRLVRMAFRARPHRGAVGIIAGIAYQYAVATARTKMSESGPVAILTIDRCVESLIELAHVGATDTVVTSKARGVAYPLAHLGTPDKDSDH